MCAIYINPVILFLTFAICFSSLLIGHASRGGFVARGARSERGKKYVWLRYRGRGETVVNSSPCLRGGVSSIYRALSIIRQRL